MKEMDDVIDVVKEAEKMNAENKEEQKDAALETPKENAPEIKKESSESAKEKAEKKEEPKKEPEEAKDEKKSTEPKTEKEVKDEKKEADKKPEKEVKAEKKDTEKESEKETLTEKKDTEKESEKNKEKDAEEKSEKKENPEVSNKALTQSKRIAEAKEAAQKAKEQQPETEPSKPKSGKKGLGIAIGSIVCVLVIAYIAGFVYFSGHYYSDVTINGIAVSGMNAATAKNTLDQFYSNYALALETIDNEKVMINGKDISIKIALHDDFKKCLKEQKPYIWFVNYFKHHEYQVSADATWNEDELQDVYKNMDILNKKKMEAPEDAYVGVEDGKFTIVKEVLGTTIKEKTFKTVVEENLKTVQSSVNLKDSDCYELPEVYSDDKELAAELKALGKYADCNIKLQLDDLTLEPGMDLYENVLEKKGDSYELSEQKVKKYVAKLAEEYDTLGTDRTFTTSFDDKKVKVHGDAFGYKMNQEETEAALIKALKAGKSTTVDVVFDEKGISLKGDNDIGDTYIEVNLSEQRVLGYKDGKLIAEGDCVSGKEAAGMGTCIGLYKIQDKLSPTVLRGEKVPVTKTETKKNKKGKKVKKTTTTYEYSYESPVTYWIQFNGGIGLHDAAGWRSQYGGSIYYYSGSHGCVNLPLDLAKTLYQNFELGDPVIVYFWDNENRK